MTGINLTLGLIIDLGVLWLLSRRWRIRLNFTNRRSLRLRDAIRPYHGAAL